MDNLTGGSVTVLYIRDGMLEFGFGKVEIAIRNLLCALSGHQGDPKQLNRPYTSEVGQGRRKSPDRLLGESNG
jgi:hypothetical protein